MKQITNLEYGSLIWFIIRASYVGLTINNLIIMSRQDAWICGVLGMVLGLIPLAIFIYIRKTNINVLDLNKKIFGKAGTLFNFIIAIGAFCLILILFLSLTNFVNSQFLFKTNYFYICLCFIIPIFYALYKGINAITKTSLLLFYLVMISVLLITFGLFKNVSLDNVKPFFENNFSSLMQGSLFLVAYNILPLFFLLVIPKDKITNYKARNSIVFYLLGMFSLINALFLVIGIFGSDLALLYDYPEFHILKKVKIGDFADRLEDILSLEWIIALFMLIVIGLYFISQTFKKTFNLKEKTVQKFNAFVCLFVFGISQLSLKLNKALTIVLEDNLIYILYLCFLFIPFITFLGCLKKLKS